MVIPMISYIGIDGFVYVDTYQEFKYKASRVVAGSSSSGFVPLAVPILEVYFRVLQLTAVVAKQQVSAMLSPSQCYAQPF